MLLLNRRIRSFVVYFTRGRTHGYLCFSPENRLNAGSPLRMIGMKGTASVGTTSCVSSGVERGLVKSAMTNRERPARIATVSITSLFSGGVKSNTMGTKPIWLKLDD